MPALSPQQVEELKRKGLTDARISELAAKKGYTLPATGDAKGSLIDNVRGVFDSRAAKATDAVTKNVQRFNESGTGAVDTFIKKPALIGQTVGQLGQQAALAAGDLGFEALRTAGRATGLAEPATAAARGLVEGAMKDPTLGPGIKILTDFYDSLDEDSRSAVDQAFTVASLGGSGKAADIAKKTSTELGAIARNELTPGLKGIDGSKISSLYAKAVKPSVGGIASDAQRGARDAQMQLAVKTIVDNKPKFREDGDIVSQSRLPKNLSEFSESIGQTKKQIFEQYDNLAKNASSKVGVPLYGVVDELEVVAQGQVLKDFAPEVATYAKTRADALAARGEYSTVQAQDAIEHLNKSLQAFYRTPTYETASKAAIDALIANNLRKTLDESIESVTGAQYQNLKTKYGALKSIEADVTKAALRDARRNVAGLIDYTDIFSGGQVLAGISSMNPALIATGAFQKAVQQVLKRLNDPNKMIEDLFEEAARSSDTAATSASQI